MQRGAGPPVTLQGGGPARALLSASPARTSRRRRVARVKPGRGAGARVGRQVFGVPLDKMTPDVRRKAKVRKRAAPTRSRSYHGYVTVTVMSWSCHGHVMVMSRLCHGHVTDMSRSCHGHVTVRMSGLRPRCGWEPALPGSPARRSPLVTLAPRGAPGLVVGAPAPTGAAAALDGAACRAGEDGQLV